MKRNLLPAVILLLSTSRLSAQAFGGMQYEEVEKVVRANTAEAIYYPDSIVISDADSYWKIHFIKGVCVSETKKMSYESLSNDFDYCYKHGWTIKLLEEGKLLVSKSKRHFAVISMLKDHYSLKAVYLPGSEK